jgi:hypothetical protein
MLNRPHPGKTNKNTFKRDRLLLKLQTRRDRQSNLALSMPLTIASKPYDFTNLRRTLQKSSSRGERVKTTIENGTAKWS